MFFWNSSLKKDLETLQIQNSQALFQIKDLQEKLDLKFFEQEINQKFIRQIEQKFQQIQLEVKEKNSKLEKLTILNTQFQEQLTDIEKNHDKLQTENNQLKIQNHVMESELKQKNEMIHNLQKKLTAQQQHQKMMANFKMMTNHSVSQSRQSLNNNSIKESGQDESKSSQNLSISDYYEQQEREKLKNLQPQQQAQGIFNILRNSNVHQNNGFSTSNCLGTPVQSPGKGNGYGTSNGLGTPKRCNSPDSPLVNMKKFSTSNIVKNNSPNTPNTPLKRRDITSFFNNKENIQ